MRRRTATRRSSRTRTPFASTALPNPHLAFGIGEHFCLGTHLARQSQRALLREWIGRVDRFDLAGDPAQIASSFVVGLKHLPVRYRLRQPA